MKIRRNNTVCGPGYHKGFYFANKKWKKKTTKSPGKKAKGKKLQTDYMRCLHAADAVCSTQLLTNSTASLCSPNGQIQLRSSSATAAKHSVAEHTNRSQQHHGTHGTKAFRSLNTCHGYSGSDQREALFFFLDNNSAQSQTYEMWFGTRSETSMWIFHICFHKKTVIMNSTLVHPVASWSVRPSSPTGDRQQGSRVFHSSTLPRSLESH